MTPDEALDHLQAVLADIAPDADLRGIKRTANLREELDIDSMDFLRLVQGVHARTGIDVPEADYRKVASLEALVAYLVGKA